MGNEHVYIICAMPAHLSHDKYMNESLTYTSCVLFCYFGARGAFGMMCGMQAHLNHNKYITELYTIHIIYINIYIYIYICVYMYGALGMTCGT